MLILTRHPGQPFKIGDDVTITILMVRGNQVRIGVEAPKNVIVHRKEIYERIQRGEGEWRKPERGPVPAPQSRGLAKS